jgi:spore germination cell wall hydrolase CwlJ-like protein
VNSPLPRFGRRPDAATVLVVLGLLLSLLSAAAWAYGSKSAGDPKAAQSVTASLSPATAAKLVADTSAAPDQVRAIGEEAKIINAALPFSNQPLQAAHPFVIGDGRDHQRALLCLTQAVYYEAGFEPLAGRRAVAQVVLNRMRHPAFPKSICGVVYQVAQAPVCQFSFVCDGSLNRAPAPVAWAEARKVAEAAIAGYVEPSVGAATHYHADYVAPYWAPRLTKLTKIGSHIFYRLPGTWGQVAAFTGAYRGEAVDPAFLRPMQAKLVTAPIVSEPAEPAGPPVARAPNDVGGLLDTSKGWTLSIPDPREVSRASSRTVAQQNANVAPKVSAAAAASSGAAVVVAQ